MRHDIRYALEAATTDPDNFCGRTIRTTREGEIMRVSKNHAKKSGGRMGRQPDGLQRFLARGRPAVLEDSHRYSSVLKYYTVVNKVTRNLPRDV